MQAARYVARFEKSVPFYLQRILSLSSSSSVKPELANNSSENVENQRKKWRKALKFSWNSASFVGRVEGPLYVKTIDDDKLRVSTFLRVRPSSDPTSEFRVLLKMWDEMARSCLGHLKPNDLIYVEGPLESYKTVQNGCSKLQYQITAKKLNHMEQHGQTSKNQNNEEVQSKDVRMKLERQKEHLHLWQVFFSNPNEWYDRRKSKTNPKQPDFKHRDTGEALWLSSWDPPWICKQLAILDAHRTQQNMYTNYSSEPHSSFSKWL